ncbi:ATP-binding protein [Anatilimnocola sp. NA78]|uniref:HD domain-containing protein n=1 Tax=Anatilimnocola sp. NA78 TaxID=3415683 RepID=UPI003CE491DC
MYIFETTSLWDRTLAPKGEGERAERARTTLREAFLSFRARAELLANEIPQDLRLLTVHDITHIDALWEIADLVAGEQFAINPVEAFVLGGSFLLHDLGMSLSAYNEGITELKQHSDWSDVIASIYRKRTGRLPKADDLRTLDPDDEREAKEQLLRNLHAQKAESLATTAFRHRSVDQSYYLLESNDLRHSLGGLIGQLAFSHWWTIDRVADQLDRIIGSPVFCPREWRIDPLKIACLLRVSDVCHLDARRAPGFLRALRKPNGIAESHWLFQEHLHKPDVELERIRFSTSRPFTKDESAAWWLCYDTLKYADRELRDVDSLLRDSGREPMAAQGVTGIDDPIRLQKHIPTSGWDPVDVQIKTTDIASLVHRLGGAELYGEDPTVPLRELIQNSTDAVRARRVMEDRPIEWGEVCVRIDVVDGTDVVVISDNGIGMTRAVLCGPFLDFGQSYWGSNLMIQENPGLLRKGFRSTGRFGIGFYSAFMWGDRVEVVTRSRKVGPSDTLVLEFKKGLRDRPVLRRAADSEQLLEAGTVVKVWMKTGLSDAGGLLSPDNGSHRIGEHHPTKLPDLVGWLCPASDVAISVKEAGDALKRVVNANDWTSLDCVELLRRIIGGDEFDCHAEYIGKLASRMRAIVDSDGNVVARISLPMAECRQFESLALIGEARDDLDDDEAAPPYSLDCSPGVVVAGGFRASSLEGLVGVVVGNVVTAARNRVDIVVDEQLLSNWVNEQRTLGAVADFGECGLMNFASQIRHYGGDTDCLPIANTLDGWNTYSQIAAMVLPDEVILVEQYLMTSRHNIRALPNVFVTSTMRGYYDNIRCSVDLRSNCWPWSVYGATLAGAVIEAVSFAWGCDLDDVLASSLFPEDSDEMIQVAVRNSGKPVYFGNAIVLRKPAAPR